MNFVKFLGTFFCRTPLAITFTFFFSILQISQNLLPRSIGCNYGNQVETSLSSCGQTWINLGIGIERKGRTEKIGKV